MWILGMNSENAKSSTFSARKTRSDIRTYPRKLKKFKGDESIFICGQAAISADRPKLLTQCALCTQSDEGRSWSILQVLQNPDQSFKICKFGSICKFATPDRASTIGNSPSLKTLLSPKSSRCTFFTIFMWVSRFRSVGTLQRPAAKISCLKIHPLSSLTGKMIFRRHNKNPKSENLLISTSVLFEGCLCLAHSCGLVRSYYEWPRVQQLPSPVCIVLDPATKMAPTLV